jgi:hypothetical protein
LFRRPLPRGVALAFALLALASACSGGSNKNASSSSSSGGGAAAATPRVPEFGASGTEAPSVKVLSTLDPTTIIQFPLSATDDVKAKFGQASGLVTVVRAGDGVDSDIVIVDVFDMPPETKFTVFLTETSAKPFGRAEYVGDVLTRDDGTGESTFHLIALEAFAADNRNPGQSTDQSGDASGVQLEHLGVWFDAIDSARDALGDPGLAGTAFDGGPPPLHGGPQVLTDGQDKPVL